MSLNKVMLIGRLGKDPELRYMPNGEAVCNATLATSESWKDKAGAKQERSEWHNLVFYRRLAEVAGEYLKKGAQVYIEGKIQSRKYQTKEGQDRYITEIIVSEMQMLGGKPSGESRPAASGGNAAAPASAPAAPAPSTGGDGSFADPEQFSDDIPFVECSLAYDATVCKANGGRLRGLGRC